MTGRGLGYGGYQGLNVQSYLPVNKRRELSEAEEAQVARERGKLLRAPFASDTAALAGGAGSLAGLLAGGATYLNEDRINRDLPI